MRVSSYFVNLHKPTKNYLTGYILVTRGKHNRILQRRRAAFCRPPFLCVYSIDRINLCLHIDMCVNPFCEGLRRLMPDNFFDNAFIDIVNSLRPNRLNPFRHFRRFCPQCHRLIFCWTEQLCRRLSL